MNIAKNTSEESPLSHPSKMLHAAISQASWKLMRDVDRAMQSEHLITLRQVTITYKHGKGCSTRVIARAQFSAEAVVVQDI
jgi:hypothetical protein